MRIARSFQTTSSGHDLTGITLVDFCLGEPVGVHVDGEYLRTLGGEQLGRRSGEARSGSRDEQHAIREASC